MDRRGVRWMGLSALLLWVGLCLGLGEPAELPAGGPAEVVVEGQPLVALTFDDGPRQDTTGQLLEGLALRETPATFFLVGERIAGQEELVRAMAEGGHQIGIHTYDHVRIAGLSRSDFEEQMERPQTLLNEILGQGDYWFRPPYGIVDSAVIQWADGPLILWSVDPEDWKDRDADRIVNAVLERVQDGDIILMHDIYDSSVDAALRIVDALLEQGYCFVTVEQLMAQRQVEPERGVLYTSLP